MPNRIIKESICTSESIDCLGWFDEVVFYRLLVNCDDFGRFDGRVSIIKSRLFPLKETITAKAVSGAIDKLASAGLVTLYVFEGKLYLHLPSWHYHQSQRAAISKYPDPEGCQVLPSIESFQQYSSNCKQMKSDEINCKQMKSDEINCNQMKANAPDIRYSNAIFECDIRESGEGACAREPSRRKYGQYGNVLLSAEDYQKLTEEFPSDYQQRIERLSEYIASTGKKYKNHLATIRSWARKDTQQSQKSGNVFLEIAKEEGIV